MTLVYAQKAMEELAAYCTSEAAKQSQSQHQPNYFFYE